MPSLAQHQSNDFTKLSVEDVIAIFNRPITVNEHNCWLWLGATDARGYARYSGNLVHAILAIRTGKILPEGKEHCHTCPNKNCINPDHAYAGTHQQNMQDAADAGVMGQGPRRVTQEQIDLAKSMLAEGATQRKICATIGVSEAWFTKFKNGGLKYAKLS